MTLPITRRSSVVSFATALLSTVLSCTPDGHDAPAAESGCCEELVASPADTPLPGDSVWQLGSRWVDQDGSPVALGDLRGRVTVAAMIFTNCLYACPTLVDDMRQIEAACAALPGTAPRFLLLSMDHLRDEPAALRAFAEQHQLDAQWTLLHGGEFAVREIAAVLGVRYRRAPSGDYAHSNQIAVLDHDGRIVHRQHGLQADSAATVAAVQGLLAPTGDD